MADAPAKKPPPAGCMLVVLVYLVLIGLAVLGALVWLVGAVWSRALG